MKMQEENAIWSRLGSMEVIAVLPGFGSAPKCLSLNYLKLIVTHSMPVIWHDNLFLIFIFKGTRDHYKYKTRMFDFFKFYQFLLAPHNIVFLLNFLYFFLEDNKHWFRFDVTQCFLDNENIAGKY